MNTAFDNSEQVGVRCTIMRGGTSKGLYFLKEDLPPPGFARDALLKALVGSEDLLQIDGLGGSRLITAKLAIVGPSTHPEADVDYTYGIVPPGRGLVVYTSNCGNISAAVGPFAIANGLVKATEPVAQVRIHNTNTGKILVAHVKVQSGQPRVKGDFAIPGVPRAGAEIFMDYKLTTGAKTGKVLPSANPADELVMESGERVRVTMGDVANPGVFLRADEVGCTGRELPDEINANERLLATLKEIRGKAAEKMGLASNWRQVDEQSPALPFVVLVAPPSRYTTSEGVDIGEANIDLLARFVFYNKCHESMAGTGAMCTAAMSRIPATVVHDVVPVARREAEDLNIGHPLGSMRVLAKLGSSGANSYDKLGFGRTARCLMEGVAYVPRELVEKK
jgi:2-methylaconitate cis-trans-isomerase PrpF